MSGVPYLHLHAASTNEPSCLSVILSLKSGKLSEGYYVVTESLFSYPPVTNPSDLPCHLSPPPSPFFLSPLFSSSFSLSPARWGANWCRCCDTLCHCKCCWDAGTYFLILPLASKAFKPILIGLQSKKRSTGSCLTETKGRPGN